LEVVEVDRQTISHSVADYLNRRFMRVKKSGDEQLGNYLLIYYELVIVLTA
jgi:hypothetical protein